MLVHRRKYSSARGTPSNKLSRVRQSGWLAALLGCWLEKCTHVSPDSMEENAKCAMLASLFTSLAEKNEHNHNARDIRIGKSNKCRILAGKSCRPF